MTRAILSVISVALAAGCVPDLPELEGDPQGEASSSSGGEGSSGADEGGAAETSAGPHSAGDDGDEAPTDDPLPATCADAGGRCVAPAPSGWSGPVSPLPFAAGEAVPRCGAPYPVAVDRTLWRDLQGTDFSCDCACGPATGVDCLGTATIHYTTDPNTTACDDGEMFVMSSALQEGGSFASGLAAWSATPTQSQIVGGACAPIDGSSFETPSFAEGVTLCQVAAEPGECAPGSTCVPSPSVPFAGPVCVFREGEHACPEGAGYTERTKYHSDWIDDRACGACTCTTPSGACADPTLSLAYWLFELVDVETIPADGDCHVVGLYDAPGMVINTAIYDAGDPVAACDPTPGAGEGRGAVTATDPVTVCCTPS